MEQIRNVTPDQDESNSKGHTEVPRDTASTDVVSILRLQRVAGNRAVDGLIRGGRPAQRGRREMGLRHAVQRFWGDEELGPTEETPIESDFVPPSLQWPSEAEGERNEPCFTPESQGQILDGAAHADVAASGLFKMPPDLEGSAKELVAARESWEATGGSEPGQGELSAAASKAAGATERLATYIVPVRNMLEASAAGTRGAAQAARDASTMKTEPAAAPGQIAPEPEPCFEDGQIAIINEGAALADAAAAEIDVRPPDFRKSVEYLRAAADMLEGVGGSEPGQGQLKNAVATLDRVADVIEAYITPVEAVVADAARDAQAASQQAREASEMSVRGPYAPPTPE